MVTEQPGARRATRADRHAVTTVLTEAFATDPVISHLIPPGVARREQRLRAFFAMETPRSLRHRGAWVTADSSAAAIWYPPGRWRDPTWLTFLEGPVSAFVFGRRLALASRVLLLMQQHHPREPHHYLLYLGAASHAQGTGRGSALLRAVLDECDRDGTPAYLEATSERNRVLYRRHGFQDREPLPLPQDGPPLYPMWRDPQR